MKVIIISLLLCCTSVTYADRPCGINYNSDGVIQQEFLNQYMNSTANKVNDTYTLLNNLVNLYNTYKQLIVNHNYIPGIYQWPDLDRLNCDYAILHNFMSIVDKINIMSKYYNIKIDGYKNFDKYKKANITKKFNRISVSMDKLLLNTSDSFIDINKVSNIMLVSLYKMDIVWSNNDNKDVISIIYFMNRQITPLFNKYIFELSGNNWVHLQLLDCLIEQIKKTY